MQGLQRWDLPRRHGSRLRRFAGEAVLYDGFTGDCHLLSDLAALVVASLYERHRSVDEIVHHVSRSPGGFVPGASLVKAVEATLHHLAQRGLVSAQSDEADTISS